MKIFFRLKYTITIILALFCLPIYSIGERKVFTAINTADGLADNSAQTIKCTKTGRMVITTIGHVNFYEGDKFSHIDTEQEDFYTIENYRGNYRLYFDRNHHLWLKDKYTVSCVNLTLERFVSDVKSVFGKFGVKGRVDDIFVDSEFTVWLLQGGKLINTDTKKVIRVEETRNLQDVEVAGGQYFLFYDNGEMHVYDRKSHKQAYKSRAYPADSANIYNASSTILVSGRTLYQIRNGSGDNAVLMKFDADNRQWKTIMTQHYHINNMTLNNGILYVASSRGYWEIDTKTGERFHHERVLMKDGSELLTDINDIEFDRQGGVWLGTKKRGLLYAKIYRHPFTKLSLDNPKAIEYSAMMDQLPQVDLTPYGKNVNCMLIDSRGWLWTGTFSGLRLHRMKGESRFFTDKDGLMNNVIHSIIEDDNHYIWVATSNGISVITIKDNEVHHIFSYDENDNIPTESFDNGKAIKLPDGSIAMKAVDHVVVFNPARFKTLNLSSRFKLYPKLINVLVNGVPVKAGQELDGNVVLEKAVTRTQFINLNSDQNTLTLTFSGLNYFRPIQTYYRVRVIGDNNDSWKIYSYFSNPELVDKKGLLHLPLFRLKPGEYKVNVQASFYPDNWNMPPMELTIRVNEPWWRTTGVMILMLVVVGLIAAANLYYYNVNYRLMLRRNTQEIDVVKRLRSFIERSNGFTGELLSPSYEEIHGDSVDYRTEVSAEFQQTVIEIMPLFQQHGMQTIGSLSDKAGMSRQEFYNIISKNLYRSPRLLARTLRLQRASDLLTGTDKSIEEISETCGFCSPNYFIACFFHQFKMTPAEYREENK